jgi:hypothetical protein
LAIFFLFFLLKSSIFTSTFNDTYIAKFTMTSVSVGPPDLKNVDPTALSIAKFLRRHPLLKQREGIINEQRKDFFRGK